MPHFATCYDKRMKMPKISESADERGNRSSVHSLCKYSRTCKKMKMLAVHLHHFTTKMKFLGFIPRLGAYSASSEIVKGLIHGACIILQ